MERFGSSSVVRHILACVSIGVLTLLTACGGGGGGGSPQNPPPDTRPDAFAFTAQSGVEPSTVVTSNEVTISGINAAASVAITGGEYSINGGAFTNAAEIGRASCRESESVGV